MIKRLLAASILSILFLLGMQWVSVTPVYASANLSKASPSIASATLSLAGRNAQLRNVADSNSQPSITIIDPASASFSPPSPHDVALNIAGTQQINLNSPISLSGTLIDLATRQGIPDKTIIFSTFGVVLGQTHTLSTGGYKIEINKNLPAGKYQVTATFKGAHLLSAASTAMTFEVLPATFKVVTVPPVPGVTFQMAGQTFVSGQDGTASISVDKAGQYQLAVLLDKYNNPSEQVKFGRWSVESFQPSRDVQIPNDTFVQVGLNIYYKINMKFLDLEGFPVDPSRISAISIRSIQGDVFTLKPGDTPWLPASRTTRSQIGLEQTDLLYSINSVTIDGSNVVNSAQQRFYAKIDDTWSINLLLYSLHITARDALFASPTGTSVEVIAPSGQSTFYPLDPSGRLDLHALARGIYHVNLIGTNGLGTSTPVALSRNQVVNLNIVTRMDMAVVGMCGIFFALGLIIYGRPWILGYLLRRKRYSSRMMGKDFGS
jgi:hypothetical protein